MFEMKLFQNEFWILDRIIESFKEKGNIFLQPNSSVGD